MRKQRGFTIIEFLMVMAIIGSISAITIMCIWHDVNVADLKTYYGITAVPKTAQEKAIVRPYMQSRLTEYEKAAAVACAVKIPTEVEPVKDGAEVSRRVLEYRKACNDATRNLRIAQCLYFDDFAIGPKR